MKRAWATVGAVVGAVLASSHHALHVALVSVGLAAAGTTLGETGRRIMLVASAVLTALTIVWIARRKMDGPPLAGAVAGATASCALLAWTVVTLGW